MKIDRLQYITQGNSEEAILAEVQAVLNAGVNWVQLRIKDDQLDRMKIALKVKVLCAGKATFIINDKVAIAQELNADGVHLGLDDMPILEARKILGIEKIIGGTANTLEDCKERMESGADYIGLGPFRTTTTKKKLSPILGLEGYRHITPKTNGKITIPVVAIGGIELDDIKMLKSETGLYGIAVSGLIAKASDKEALVNEIYKNLE